MGSDASDADVIVCHGVKVARDRTRLSDRMLDVMETNRYERPEIQSLRKLLKPTDRVLELGAGAGVVSTIAAQTVGPENVLAVEANPNLIDLIRQTHRLNGVEGIRIVSGAVRPGATADTVPFHQRENFWGSSADTRRGDRPGDVETVNVPVVDLKALISDFRPQVLVVDIEGTEVGLFDTVDLSGVRSIILELHPREYGLRGVAQVTEALGRQGFAYDVARTSDKSVTVFSRVAENAVTAPRVAVVTCMKDEGPFVLEWVAYHKSIGVTDLTIFSNDCTDGTDLLLDRLDELGVLRHFPNPSTVANSASHQPLAIQYAQQLRNVRTADWIISMDADEFMNIHVGDGTLSALIAALPDADAISLLHLDFGSSDITEFTEGFVTEQMLRCQTVNPAHPHRRGIKTLVGKTARILRPANHRPLFDDPESNGLVWYDGGGRRMAMEHATGKAKGIDCRGAYQLAQMNHYAVKSHDSYLTKVARGDAVDPRWARNLAYWNQRNSNEDVDETILRHLPRARAQFDRLMTDAQVRDLHARCVQRHKTQITELRQMKDMQELLDGMKGKDGH